MALTFVFQQTSNSLLWMLYHLGRLPHIQEKLSQEIDMVVGKDENITADNLAKLSYLKACLKESMRYFFVVF